MSTREKKRTKHNIFVGIIVAFFITFISVNIYNAFTVPITTQVVRYGELENILDTNGFVIRNESIVVSPAGGMLSCAVKEGERVSKDSLIASVFVGQVDETTSLRLKRITERIADFGDEEKSAYYTDDISLAEFQISSGVNDIILAMRARNMRKVSKCKDELFKMLDRYKGEAADTTYSQIIKEKKDLETSINAVKKDVYAPVAGVFTSKIDGYEDMFDIKDLSKITPNKIDEAMNYSPKVDTSIEQGKPVVKIFDNYNWFYASIIDSSLVKNMKIGDSISIRFPDISNNMLPASIASINTDESGRTSIVVSCRYYEESVYRRRKSNCQIVLGTYKGIKVPMAAVRVKEDGSQGVFIVKDDVARYKSIEILYTGSGYVIAKPDDRSTNSLTIYDEVIISKKNIYDGQVIR